jgi:hypothetical protein
MCVQMDVVPFLGCLKDTSDRWVTRVDALLHPSPSDSEDPEVAPSDDSAPSPEDEASAKRARRAEADKVQEAARLVAEHRLLDLTIDDDKVHELRVWLWTTIVPLALAPPPQPLPRPALTLEALMGMIDEGARLGQKRSPHVQRLSKARDAARTWLAKAIKEKPFTTLASKLPRPPHADVLDLGAEWGYARYTASMLYRQRLALSKQTQLLLKQQLLKQQQEEQQAAVVQVVNGTDEAAPVEKEEEEAEEGPKAEVQEAAAEGQGEEVVQAEAFCLCRGGEVGQMVNCEGCGEWYHFDCVGYKPPPRPKKGEPKPKGDRAYVCIICAESRHKRYKFQWASSVTAKRGAGGGGGPAAKKKKGSKASKGGAKRDEEESDLDDMDMETSQ